MVALFFWRLGGVIHGVLKPVLAVLLSARQRLLWPKIVEGECIKQGQVPGIGLIAKTNDVTAIQTSA